VLGGRLDIGQAMTRRRKRIIIGLAVVAVVAALAGPAIYWRLTGWAAGEPFWQGRPVSYYRSRILAARVYTVHNDEVIAFTAPTPTWEVYVRRTVGNSAANWLAERREGTMLDDPLEGLLAGSEPLLERLVNDPDPSVQLTTLHHLFNWAQSYPAARKLIEARAEAAMPDDPLLPHIRRTLYHLPGPRTDAAESRP
jgi:hypothetical protein